MFPQAAARKRRKRNSKAAGPIGTRRLCFDSLEERTLLSVTPSTLSAILVNQTFGSAQVTNTAHSSAVDSSGDFVVTWSVENAVLNPSATQITFDPTAAATQPITGTFELDVGGVTTSAITFNSTSTATLNTTATNIQTALSNAGQPFASVTYTQSFTSTSYNFTINYGTGNTAPSLTYVANAVTPLPIYFSSAEAPIIDPSTDAPYTQSNVYARYFTPEVQQLTLPVAATVNSDNNANTVGRFSLEYDAETQMELAVTAGTAPAGDLNAPLNPNILGSFTLWFDANGNGTVDPGETLNVNYDETNPTAAATQIQNWLQSFTPVTGISNAQTVSVNAIDPQHLMIDFGAATQGLDQSNLLQYLTPANGGTTDFTGGYLPAVSITTLDRPFAITNIPISQTNPEQTAEAIESWFDQPGGAYSTGVAPFNFLPQAEVTGNGAPYVAPVYSEASVTDAPQTGFDPSVSVVPVSLPNGTLSLTEFDITFTGNSGYQIEPQLLVTSVTTETGTAIPTSQASSVILKETSPQFQVNPVTPPTSIFSQTPIIYNSDQPAVAMDASGDFAITWREEVSQQLAPKDGTDIFMRMYTPVGITNSFDPGLYVPGQVVTGVRLLPSPVISQQQQLTFTYSGSTTFGLTIDSNTTGLPITTGLIAYNSSNPTTTAANIQSALITAGFKGVSVSYNTPSNTSVTPTSWSYTVTFGGVDEGINEDPLQLTSGSALPSSAFSQSLLTTDMYTQTVNIDATTNPQFDPAIAMDPQGNIVIVWSSVGQDISYFNDVYMQRFDKYGNLLGGPVLVNTERTESEIQPAVAIGADDNVVVTWTEINLQVNLEGGELDQGVVYVRAFDKNSNPFWPEQEVTSLGGEPAVAMDSEDNFLITWTGGPDNDSDGATSDGVYGTEYALSGGVQSLTFATGTTTDTSLNVSGTFSLELGTVTSQTIQFIGEDPTTTAANIQAALDAMGYSGVLVTGVTQGNPNNKNLPEDVFTISFQQLSGGASAPTIQYVASFSPIPLNVTQQTISIGSAGPTTIRPEFRVSSSASNTPTSVTSWPLEQYSPAVAMDEDGDIAAVYQGDGPEVSQDLDIPASFFTSYFENLDTGAAINSDLLPYFDPFPHDGLPGDTVGFDSAAGSQVLYQNDNNSVQVSIDQILFNAEYPMLGSGITPATTEQLGRLRQILENVAGLLNGESDGVLMTQIDADPQDSQPPASIATYSDDIVNTQRSGENQNYYIILNPDEEQGTFTLTVTLASDSEPYDDLLTPVTATVTVNVPELGGDGVPYGGPDTAATQTNIWTALTTALGTIYPGIGTTGGAVDVRQVPLSEIDARNDTAWQLPFPVNDARYDAAAANEHPSTQYLVPADHGYTVYEITFQGTMHDLPITMTLGSSTMEYWTPQPTAVNGGITVTPVLVGATAPTVIDGDYDGTQGEESYNPSVSMTPEGDIISSYTTQALNTDGDVPLNSSGNAIYQNIYVEPLAESTNTAGPQLVGWNDGSGADLLAGSEAGGGTVTDVGGKYFILTFDTPMMAGNPATTPDSVLNIANYKLYNANGVQITGGISLAQYGLSEVAQLAQADPGAGFDAIPSNKWEVVLTIGNGGITNGTYTFQVDHAEAATSTTAGQTGLENIYGTSMYVSGYDPTGHDFVGSVTISNSNSGAGNPGTPGTNTNDTPVDVSQTAAQTNPAIAAAANGTYVIVWTSTTNGVSTIVGQLFKANGTTSGPEFTVNTSFYGSYADPAVAMDPNGDFVVVWDGRGADYNTITNTSDVFARIFSANGQAEGGQFQVDYYEAGAQTQPRVAMDPNGNFVVSFTSYVENVVNGQDSGGATYIYAREFSLGGSALVNSLQPNGYEFQVSNTTLSANSQFSDVAIDPSGDFVITWEGDYQNSSNWGVYARYYYANLTSTGEVRLDTQTESRGSFEQTSSIQPTGPRVGMDSSGNFDVTWANYNSADSEYDVYARQFSKGIVAVAGEFVVDQTTTGWNVMPDIGVASNGAFTIVWTSYQPEPLYPTVDTYDIEARMYNANGSDFFDTATNSYPLEFRVNATVVGDQVAPAVNRGDSAGDSFIAWAGPASTTNQLSAIFSRVVDPPPPSSNPGAAAAVTKTTTTTTATSGSSSTPSSNVPATVTTTAVKTVTVTTPVVVAAPVTVAVSKVATTTTTAVATKTTTTTVPTTVSKTTTVATTTTAATAVTKTTTTTVPTTATTTTVAKTTTTTAPTTTTVAKVTTTAAPATTSTVATTTVAKAATIVTAAPVTTSSTATTKSTVVVATAAVPAVSPKPPAATTAAATTVTPAATTTTTAKSTATTTTATAATTSSTLLAKSATLLTTTAAVATTPPKTVSLSPLAVNKVLMI